jgi:inorganic phosphate transporter, PiT family
MLLVFSVLLAALVFEYVNGFHDTANAIATSVSTKVLTPQQAVILAAIFNLVGALSGTAVALTIGNGIVSSQSVTLATILCALMAGIIWNIFTWWLGLPSSSSHALIGGLCGAAIASSHHDWSVVQWWVPAAHGVKGLVPKVIIPMFASPVIGSLIGFGVMGGLLILLKNWTPHKVNRVFGRAQLLSASWMSFSHGTNDAQKTMGIITLTLFTATNTQVFDQLPESLQFLRCQEFVVPLWVKVACALTMAAGTAAGGWRIIKTVGSKMVKMQPVHGFGAQTTASIVIQAATFMGIPLSTTHVITASILGVGATKRFSAVKWGIVGHMVWAWVLTLPITALLGYAMLRGFQGLGFK